MARDCSWSSVEFDVYESGPLARLDWPRKAVTAERRSVGGQRLVRQILGVEYDQLTVNIELDKDDYPTLAGKVGTVVATLAIVGAASIPDVILDSIGTPTIDDTNDLAFCQVTWKRP